MQRLASCLFATLLLALAAAVPAVADEAEPDLVTVVTSAEPQVQLMALVLTTQAARQGKRPYVLLCGPGGDIALKEAPASATAGQPPQDMSPQGLLMALRRTAGAEIAVCALYLPGKGIDADALIEGVTVARPPEMAARLIAPGTTVLSF